MRKHYVLKSDISPKGDSGEQVGSKYNLTTACKACGTGARLIGDLYTKGLGKVKDEYCYTIANDDIISEKLYRAIKGLINSDDVAKVVDSKGKRLPFYHLNPKFSFPKSLPQSLGLKKDRECKVCKRNGYFNQVIMGSLEKKIPTYVLPLVLHYSDIDQILLKRSNIFCTWEHMGISNIKNEGNKVVRYARPLLIVSDAVKEVFESFKIKKIAFNEIVIHANE